MVYAPADCSAYAQGMIDFSFISSEFVIAEQTGCSGNDTSTTPTSEPVTQPTPTIGASCGSGLVYDCDMNCVSEMDTINYQGDTYCDDGTYGVVLTCPTFNNDWGDCDVSTSPSTTTPTVGAGCGSGLVYDCDMNCISEMDTINYQGDTYCDDGTYGIVLTCPTFNNDWGDCNVSTAPSTTTPTAGEICGDGKVYDCNLQCVSASDATAWQGDGMCDEGYGLFLNCPAFNNDGGDCDVTPTTPTTPTVEQPVQASEVVLQEPHVSEIYPGSGPGVYCFGTSSYWYQQSVGNGGSIWTENHDAAHGVDNYCDYNFEELEPSSNYEVQVWIPPDNATTRNACYKVSDMWGTDNLISVDQWSYYDEWVSLGVFTTNGSGQLNVTLSDLTMEPYATTKIGFDAIKVVPAFNQSAQSKIECDLGGW
jgi:hypothetical protein